MCVITRLSRVNCLGYRSIRRPLADKRQLNLPEGNSFVWNAKIFVSEGLKRTFTPQPVPCELIVVIAFM